MKHYWHRYFRKIVSFSLITTFLLLSASISHLQEEEFDDNEDAQSEYLFNMALESEGATAIASSTSGPAQASGTYTPISLLDGDRRGVNWSNNNGWRCATANQYPDWVEVHFDAPKRIQEIDVFTLKDDYQNPAQPTLAETFSILGITDFELHYWNGSSWIFLAGRSQNNKVWSQFVFTPIVTEKIRLWITGALASYSRVVEIEAWGRDAFEALPTPSTTNPGGCDAKKMNPCEMKANLLAAMRGTPTSPLPYATIGQQTWQGKLNWNYSNWNGGRSQNLPLLAHAIALWRPASEYQGHNAVAWWDTFFNCQNGEGCAVSGAQHLNKMKGVELLSNTYDADSTAAIAAVRHWAVKNAQWGLADKARQYLRLTWALYAMAAGKGAARRVLHRHNANDTSKQKCQATGINVTSENSYNYNGPYLALAGMRSTTLHCCSEDRSPLFTRAIKEQWLASRGFSQLKLKIETRSQKELLDYLESQPQGIYAGENAYALGLDHQQLLLRVIDFAKQADVDFLWQAFLQKIRTSARYHFLAWEDAAGNQNRATVMETNLNRSTIAIYAVRYDHATRTSHLLLPWSNLSVPKQDINGNLICPDPQAQRDNPERCIARPEREGVTNGLARLLPTQSAPNRITATNIGQFDIPNYVHGTIEDSMNIPVSRWLYHIVLNPGAPPGKIRGCESATCQ